MHVDLVRKYLETQALLMAPICPHVAEQLWELLGNVKKAQKYSIEFLKK